MTMKKHGDIEFENVKSKRKRFHHFRTIVILSIQLIERL